MRRLGLALLMTATAGCCQTIDRLADLPAPASSIQRVSYESPETDERPRINRWLSVPLHNRYDLYCALFPATTTTVYRNCRILGLTGVKDDDSGSFSKSSVGPRREWFDDMLVLEMSDGRLAYIPPSSVKYFEGTAEPMPATSGYNSPPVNRFR